MNPTTDIKKELGVLRAGLSALQEIANRLDDHITRVEIVSSSVEPSPLPMRPSLEAEVIRQAPIQTFPPCSCIGGAPGTPHRYVATSPTGSACAHYVVANAEKFTNEALNSALGMVGTPPVADQPAVIESASTPEPATKAATSDIRDAVVAARGAGDNLTTTKAKGLKGTVKKALAERFGVSVSNIGWMDWKVRKGE